LSDEWFTQLTSERRVIRYSRGQPAARFERIVGCRAEALVGIAVDWREADLVSLTGRRSGL
jgi:hypothetical protein